MDKFYILRTRGGSANTSGYFLIGKVNGEWVIRTASHRHPYYKDHKVIEYIHKSGGMSEVSIPAENAKEVRVFVSCELHVASTSHTRADWTGKVIMYHEISNPAEHAVHADHKIFTNVGTATAVHPSYCAAFAGSEAFLLQAKETPFGPCWFIHTSNGEAEVVGFLQGDVPLLRAATEDDIRGSRIVFSHRPDGSQAQATPVITECVHIGTPILE